MQGQRQGVDRWLGIGMLLLAAGLAINTLLGPLFIGVIGYPFTETVYNETLGLEAVSLLLIAPVALVAGVLTLRGRRAGPILAIGPAAYAAYMLVQYVVGPQYASYQPSIALHIGLFILSAALIVRAWSAADRVPLPPVSRGWAVVAFLLAGFVISRWAGVFTGMASADPVPAAAPDVTMYWAIFLLDMGIIVPAGIATAIGLLIGSRWASRALFGLIGWFAMVPPSVAAMSIVKLLRDDPNGSTGDTIVFVVVTLIFWGLAAALFRRLFGAPRNLSPAPQSQQQPASMPTR